MKVTKSQIRQIIQEEIATLLSEQEPEVEVWEGVESVPDAYKKQAEALFQAMKEKKMLDSECYRPGFDSDQCRDLPGFWLVGPSDYGYEAGVELPDTDKRLYGEV